MAFAAWSRLQAGKGNLPHRGVSGRFSNNSHGNILGRHTGRKLPRLWLTLNNSAAVAGERVCPEVSLATVHGVYPGAPLRHVPHEQMCTMLISTKARFTDSNGER